MKKAIDKKTLVISLAALLLIAVTVTLCLLLHREPIERIERILTREGFTVVYTEKELHTDLEARLKATSKSGDWLDVYVFKEKDKAEAMYHTMLTSYEHLPNMVAVIDGTTVIHGLRTAYLLVEK